MKVNNEILRRDVKIKSCMKTIEELKDEITGLKQLLDCAAANMALLIEKNGGTQKISGKKVGEVLGKYTLTASKDSDGNYILELKEIKTETIYEASEEGK